MLLLTLAVLTLAASDPAAVPASAATATPAVEAAPTPPPKHKPKPKTDAEEMVCVDEPDTGSIIPHRVCATRSQWERRRRNDQEELGRVRDQVNDLGGDGR